MKTPRRLRGRHRVLLACAALGPLILGGCAGTGEGGKGEGAPAPVTGSYAFWPLFPDEPRLQYLRSLDGSDDVSPSKSSGIERLVFGPEAEQAASIEKPYGVAMRDGKIYVCDMRGGALMVMDLRKKQTRLVGVSGVNRLSHPVGVAVADDGRIYVADNERGAVLVYDAQERYTEALGFPGFKPVSLAVHGDRLYACDMAGQAIQVFDRASGERLGTIGTVGDEDGQFRLPLGVATDTAGNVYVSDMMRCRVQKFSPEGRFLAGVGTVGDFAGSFARPKHLAVDAEGIVYVVDAAFQNVQLFDAELRLLMAFGSSGEFPGSMNLPAGVCVAEEGVELFEDRLHPGFEARRLVLVTNQFGPDKVAVYALGGLRPGYTAADLARAAAPVSAGVGTTEERLRLQEQGGQEEPLPEGAAGGSPPSPPPPQGPPK